MDLRFRPATEADLDELVAVHTAAYPDARGAQERRRNLAENAFGGLSRLVVAERAGAIVGQAFLFRMASWFGGAPVRVGGIASVAVAPDARGQGVASALLDHLHDLARRRGDAITLLYAFRQGFYARLGYAATSPRKRLALDPASIPEAMRLAARRSVRRARREDRRAVVRAYERTGARASGWLLRSKALWDRIFARPRRQVLVCARGRDLAGYVAFEIEQDEPHAETRLCVEEMAYDDDEAWRALWGALGSMRDQVASIEIEVDAADPIEHALVDPDRRRFGTAAVEHALGDLVAGPMVRVVDLARAVEARGYRGSATFDLVTTDADELAVGVRVAGGRAQVIAPRGRAALRSSARGLAAVLYGGLRPSDAARLGLAEADAGTLARLDAALAMPPVLPVDAF